MTYDVGDWRTPTLTVTPADGTTAATLSIEAPDGTVTAGTAGSPVVVDGVATFTGTPYAITMAGRWGESWTVTGTGKGFEDTSVDVESHTPVPATLTTGMHATSGDYAEIIGGDLPTNINLLLRRASRQIDDALLCAIYDDTDVDVLAALAEAACEQAAYGISQGWINGIPSALQSVSIGSVSMTRGYSAAGAAASTPAGVSEQAWSVLRTAGLTGHAPYAGRG